MPKLFLAAHTSLCNQKNRRANDQDCTNDIEHRRTNAAGRRKC